MGLALTRKPGQSVMIGRKVKLTVLEVGHGRTKLLFEAPPEVRIDRAEVAEKRPENKTGELPSLRLQTD